MLAWQKQSANHDCAHKYVPRQVLIWQPPGFPTLLPPICQAGWHPACLAICRNGVLEPELLKRLLRLSAPAKPAVQPLTPQMTCPTGLLDGRQPPTSSVSWFVLLKHPSPAHIVAAPQLTGPLSSSVCNLLAEASATLTMDPATTTELCVFRQPWIAVRYGCLGAYIREDIPPRNGTASAI